MCTHAEQYFTVKQVAAKLNISERSVWRLFKNRHLRKTKIGRSTRVCECDLIAFLKDK